MLDQPGAIQVPTGALKWPKTAPKRPRMSQNPQNGSKWHCMTPDGPNDPKTLPMGICHDYMSCWTTLCPFQRPTGPHNGQKQHQKWPFMTKNGPSRTKMALHDPKWPKTLLMGILHDIMSCWTTLGAPKWPKTAPNGPLCPKMALHGPKWCFNEVPL